MICPRPRCDIRVEPVPHGMRTTGDRCSDGNLSSLHDDDDDDGETNAAADNPRSAVADVHVPDAKGVSFDEGADGEGCYDWC